MIRYLMPNERNLARDLWEKIFVEDSPRFLDAYEEIKRDNVILADLEDGKAAAMLQCNPYSIVQGHGRPGHAHYIVGVSTLPEMRHQHRMTLLLEHALKDLNAAGEPFAFLMPADEAIYTPFDFVTVFQMDFAQSTQIDGAFDWTPGQETTEDEAPHRAGTMEITLQKARPAGDAVLATLANDILTKRADVFCRRSMSYFRSLRREMQSENGEIFWVFGQMLGEDEASMLGYLAAWPGEDTDEGRRPAAIREIVCKQEAAVRQALQISPADERPLIMVRMLSPEAFLAPVCSPEPMALLLCVEDDILTETAGWYYWEIGEEDSVLKPLSTTESEEAEDLFTRIQTLSTENPQAKVDNLADIVEKSVDCPEFCAIKDDLPYDKGTLGGYAVQGVWKTTAAELTAWRFGRKKIGELEKVNRRGRIFISELV